MNQNVATIEHAEGAQEIATTTSTAVTPMDLLQKAMDTGADLDKLEKLMDMQERWETGQARKAFVSALNAFKADPPELLKNKTIEHNGKLISKYAGLDQVSRVIGEALTAHGLSHRWDTEQNENGIAVTCILTHEQGHSEKTTLRAGADTSGSKNTIQAIGSTVTYLQRYTLLAATGMSVGDMDDDGGKGGMGEVIDETQKDILLKMIRETGVDTKKFLAFFGVESVDQIPARQFDAAKGMLNSKKAKAAEKGGDA